MAVELFTNQGSTTVSSGGTTAPSPGSSESWTVTSSASFPAITSGQQFHVADPASASTAAEIIAVTAVSGTTWTVTRGAESTAPVAHASGFTVQQVISAASLSAFAQAGNGDLGGTGAAPTVAKIGGSAASGQYARGNGSAVAMSAIQVADLPAGTGDQAWQFRPETYGAKGDGKLIGDVVVNTTTTITSATASFTAGDVGKHIQVHGANGSSAGPLISTISSVTNSTTAVLADAAGTSRSGCPAIYGTDDTAAINSAVTAAGTYALANNYFAEVVFKPKTYILSAAPTQTGNGSTTPTFNAQIPLPYPAAGGTTQKLVIALTGAGDQGYFQYWESLVPNVAGSALVSLQTAPGTTDPTFGVQSVIGGPSSPAGFTGGFANIKAVIKGLQVWCPLWTNMTAYDFRYVSAVRATQSGAHIFAPTGVNGAAAGPYLSNISAGAFLSSHGVAWAFPVTGNNADITADDIVAEGYELHYLVFDHFQAGKLNSIYADVCMKFDGTVGVTGTSHAITIQQITAEAYNGGFRCNGGTAQVDIHWDAECSGVSYDVFDGGVLHGNFYFRDPAAPRQPTLSNGVPFLRVISDEQHPGHWSSPPSVPASTVAQVNTAYRDAWIVLHTGAGVTVSVINIDGTNTGLTMAASSSLGVRVASAKTITLTYAGGTPTWDWWLD